MHSMSALSQSSYGAGHPVAVSAGQVLSWGQFLADVAATRSLVASGPGQCWALFEEDTYRFAVGLVALLAEGCRVFLPGENNAATVAALQAEGTRFLGQFAAAPSLAIRVQQSAGSPADFSLTGSIVVYTSGSTGKPKAIDKSIRQLDAELAALEALRGASLDDALVVGTVSHQHFYGLLFLVLWPICAGRRFWHRPFVDPQLLAAAVADFPACCWVMSPAHLHRLGEGMPWAVLRDRVRAVFSSGGPLEQWAAQQVYDGLVRYPLEVLGSSETGAIAWREQAAITTPWTPLPEVDVRCSPDGTLQVRSPFLADNSWYVTADAATLDADGSFRLGGRIDRIVKIEGKRIALPAVEAALQELSWIDEAWTVVVPRRRRSVGALLVLSALGTRELAALGLQPFTRRLRDQLSSRVPAAGIPRLWRIGAELPRNSQGKVLHREVQALFGGGRLPQIVNRERTGTGLRLHIQVDGELPYFDGHFPEVSVLPGIVQVMWAELFARQLLGVRGRFLGMRAVKFKEVVKPDRELILSLDYSPGEGRLEFGFESSSGPHSQGRMYYEVEA